MREDGGDNWCKIPGLSSVEFRCLVLLEVIEINVPRLKIYLVSSLRVGVLPREPR